jgi:hypothetical protein
MSKFSNLEEGQTVNILYKGIQTTAMITHKSKVQIDVKFWNPFVKGYEQAIVKFAPNGNVKYLKNENTKIISKSL